MKIRLQEAILWSGLSVVVPVVSESTASAQYFPGSCPTCQLPPANCNCLAQRPVVETQMVPRQVTVMRNEVVTQYRQEAYTQNVPVTTYRQVVVDEGNYQQVWVPKHVTKQVPQTVYQQQTAYRSVPYQATRQVPQVVTQMVPQQVVRYQPYSFQTVAPYSHQTVAAPCQSCGTCPSAVIPTATHAPVAAPSCTAPASALRNPVSLSSISPTSAATPTESAEPQGVPVPDPKFLDSPGAARESWTTVGSRNSTRSTNVASAPIAPTESQATNASGIRFKPARTVYRSWESQTQFAGEPPARQ